MMTRVFLLFLGLVAAASACQSNSGRIPAWDLGPNTEIYPTYDHGTGAVGIGITHRFKRGVDTTTKEGFFSMLDLNGDGALTAEEWLYEKGRVRDFADMLKDLDKDNNQRVSWEEFEAVKGVSFKKD